MFLLAGGDEKSGKWGWRPIAEKTELLSDSKKKVAISIPFLWSTELLFIMIKNQRSCGKYKKNLSGSSPILQFPTIPLLPKLKPVQQSF